MMAQVPRWPAATAAILAVLPLLAACNRSSPETAMNPLKPGLWRTTTTTDLTRSGAQPQRLRAVTAFVCAAPEPGRPAGPTLGIRKGCTGKVSMDSQNGVWNYTETCAQPLPSKGQGTVWGDYSRSYMVERYVSAVDPEGTAQTLTTHEVINARWVRRDCTPPET
jgi:hypothetical protein